MRNAFIAVGAVVGTVVASGVGNIMLAWKGFR